MAKDYFQDIVPPSDDRDTSANRRETPQQRPVEQDDVTPPAPPERSIRNISAPARTRPRSFAAAPEQQRQTAPIGVPLPRRRRSRVWLWIVAAVSIVALAALALVALRDTRVAVIPRTHAVTFDASTQFNAYPASAATDGALTYTVQTYTIEDSEPVTAQGTVHAEDKASGTVTVYNETAKPLKYVKTTRFSTPDGLIFRAPADIVVPAKTGTTPGQVTITIIADKPGEQYNVGPIEQFTLPGLKGSADYDHVYAKSTSPMAGGFVGERPGISPADQQAAVATVRARLEAKARETLSQIPAGSVAFPTLIQISFQDMPNSTGADGAVLVHQGATVLVPVFDAGAFARAVAGVVSADAGESSVRVVGGAGYAAQNLATSTALGVDRVMFRLDGAATLVWDVDTAALASALAGKEKAAFESIVATFPGIDRADARIQPFWSNTFPADPSAIRITVEDPTASHD